MRPLFFAIVSVFCLMARTEAKPPKPVFSIAKKDDTKTRAVQRRKHSIVVQSGTSEAQLEAVARRHYKALKAELSRSGAHSLGVWIWVFDSDEQVSLGDAGWLARVGEQGRKLPDRPTVYIKRRNSKYKPTKLEAQLYELNQKLLVEQPSRDEDEIISEVAKKFGVNSDRVREVFTKVTLYKMGSTKQVK